MTGPSRTAQFPSALRGRHKVIALLGAVTLVASLVPAATLTATETAPGATDTEELGVQSDAEAFAQDLGLMAASQGWTLQEAASQYRAAEIVGRIAEEVFAKRPDLFVGSALSAEPGGAPTLFIKGPADAFVQGLVADAEVAIVLADKQPYSFDELEERKLRVHEALVALGFRYVATGFDITDRGHIDAGVTRQDGLPQRADDLLALLPADLRASVSITVNDVPIVQDETAFGGMWVRRSGTNYCTSGWSVVNGAGSRGVMTAGHCRTGTGLVMNEINHPGHAIHSMTFRSDHRTSYGDVAWYETVVDEPAIFYADETGVIRNVTAIEHIANVSVGETVCLFGRASFNRRCLTVQKVSQTCTQGGFTTNRLVLMNGDIGTSGDSGGGWSFDTKAFGSHKGNCADVPGKEVFSAAHYFPNAIGVSVRTQ